MARARCAGFPASGPSSVCLLPPRGRRGLWPATIAPAQRHLQGRFLILPSSISSLPDGGARSADGVARRCALIDSEQRNGAVRGRRAEDENLALKACDVARTEIDHGDDEPPDEGLAVRIRRRELRR